MDPGHPTPRSTGTPPAGRRPRWPGDVRGRPGAGRAAVAGSATGDRSTDPARVGSRGRTRCGGVKRAGGNDRSRVRPGGARGARARRQPSCVDGVPGFLHRPRDHPLAGPAFLPQPPVDPCRRGQGGYPDPAGAIRSEGRLRHPRRRDRPCRRDLFRRCPGGLRGDVVPQLAARHPGQRPPDRSARGVPTGRRVLGAAPVVHGVAGSGSARFTDDAVGGAAASRSTRPVIARPPGAPQPLVYSSGFRLSPYADIRPPGEQPKSAPRKLWHASPGSSGG